MQLQFSFKALRHYEHGGKICRQIWGLCNIGIKRVLFYPRVNTFFLFFSLHHGLGYLKILVRVCKPRGSAFILVSLRERVRGSSCITSASKYHVIIGLGLLGTSILDFQGLKDRSGGSWSPILSH